MCDSSPLPLFLPAAKAFLLICTLDASRFLSQSQSRIAPGDSSPPREFGDRSRRPDRQTTRPPPSRPYLQRALGNPYSSTASQTFAFSPRSSVHHAPLFHSNNEHLPEEDDERDAADFYALQRSRRHFGASRLAESSEGDEGEDSKHSEHSTGQEDEYSRGTGIRSSWRGKASVIGPAGKTATKSLEEQPEENEEDVSEGTPSSGKGRMVEVRLEDSVKTDAVNVDYDDDDPPPEFTAGGPPIRQFQNQSSHLGDDDDEFQTSAGFIDRESDKQALLNNTRPPSSIASEMPTTSMARGDPEPPMHDMFWGHMFLLCLSGLFATSFIVYLHTTAPTKLPLLGDTIYATLHSSFGLLGTYTVISIFVALLWLALLRSYVRPLVFTMLIAVPVILISFSLYPFISSFKGTWHGSSIQDKVMRWGSIVPAVMAATWIYSVVKGRHATGKAIDILEFSCRILAANPALLLLGFATIALIALWSWAWILMFTRVFLGGHLASGGKRFFIIDIGTWWLGVYFILVYLWSLGVIAGIQRTTTAAVVSQWYFHRNATPAPTSHDVIRAAFTHALTTLFGTICLSTLLSLLVRIPLIVLPRRISSMISLAAYSCVPTPIAALTNPLTLTYAAIHSQPLVASARSLNQMVFLAPSAATAMTFHPRTFSDASRTDYYSSTLMPYRLAKMLLHATRFMMSLALGFGGWVSTARSLQVSGADGSKGSTMRGSLYAYIVGLIAGTIGWGVLSAMEGVLAGVVDAAVVCWASEVGSVRREARYCREAGHLFGGGSADRMDIEDRSPRFD
ncbi:uncharacterized protein ARB_04249 [Trichophyton benhamiae CBS 112371]|uniref:Protein PNS1 n=1 Tax=Arthroderma benhamiae (strain ATCC MYA-4681 / CBS 112371) TaxID=663331 RepID=D4AJ01_ARTBC|nr:uncharacterized protein ARB_04249 [Trichophyton benhamiae CBS 112371]EFE36724.1 hypothetical protein ARB_04249 [Trichophyton benhamiae CBS 112371]